MVWPVPSDQHVVRSLVGLCTFYWQTVEGFADIANAPYSLKDDKTPFKWPTLAPILSHQRYGQLFIVDTHASNIETGGLLSQIKAGEEKVIAYFSRSCRKPRGTIVLPGKSLWQFRALP